MSLGNSFKPWTDRDETVLTTYFCANYSFDTISKILNRTTESIKYKLIKLGLIRDPEPEEKMKRYLTFYVDYNGSMKTILGRRGYTSDDIIRQTLDKTAEYGNKTGKYLLEIGDEGTYGGSLNCKLFKITPKPPIRPYTLEKV